MRIILIWINLFSIVFTVKIGASLSASEDQNLNHIYDDLLELSYNDLTTNDKQRLSAATDKSEDDLRRKMNADVKQPTKEEEKVLVVEQSTIPHQVEMEMYGDEKARRSSAVSAAESGRKRKSFSKRKKKKKRRKHRQQKNEKFIHGSADVKSENLTLSTVTANVMTTESNYVMKIIHKNEAEDVVMEMVEAVIDNNNNENNLEIQAKSQNAQLSQVEEKSRENLQNRAESDTTESMSVKMKSNPLHSSDQNSKIDKRLKRRRKFIIGDLSCMKAVFVPAPRVANADIKYIRNELYGFEKSFLEAEYHCQNGYKLIKKSPKRKSMTIAAASGKNLICKKRRWLGQKPFCRRIKNPSTTVEANTEQQCDSNEAQKCEQLCIKTGNRTEASCFCHKGFRLIGTRCLDVNECKENSNICRHGKCINLIGAFKCSCEEGFQLDSNGKCIDINECLLRNGHGGCQDTCVNTVGAYKCSCDNLKGTKLSKDGHSCESVEICSVNNGGCSHTCHDTIGEAFCSCPEGYKLDEDWKTCIDIDECQLQDALSDDMRCNYECINTIGSYRCVDVGIGADQPINVDFDDYNAGRDGYKDYKVGSDDTDGNYDIIDGASVVSECLNGFYFNESVGDCQDINECEIDNGNCSNGTCVNTNGSFYCLCHKGFMLSEDDRYKCIPIEIEQHKKATEENPLNRVIVVCPPLFPPTHGYLECTRPVENSTTTGRMKIINRPGSECRLRCPTSYRASGTYIRTCGNDGKWHGYDDGICIKYPTPRLICPPNQLLELPEKSKKVQVKLQRPKTDVNFKRDITIKPSWIKSEKITLGIGVQNITYTAKHPISKLTLSCTTSIFVVDGSPPVVDYCPASQKHKVEKHHESLKVSWTEPKFSDNVKVTDVTQTNMAGSLFGLGSHQIIYEARDAAGYKSRCSFKIIINAPKREGLKLPIKNNKFYY